MARLGRFLFALGVLVLGGMAADRWLVSSRPSQPWLQALKEVYMPLRTAFVPGASKEEPLASAPPAASDDVPEPSADGTAASAPVAEARLQQLLQSRGEAQQSLRYVYPGEDGTLQFSSSWEQIPPQRRQAARRLEGN